MLATFSQSWFFFMKNYRVLAIAMAVFALIFWLLEPDVMHQNIRIDNPSPEAIEQLLQEIDFVAIATFVLVTEVFGLLFFTCLFREIILFPERRASQLLLPALRNMIPASISFIAALALVSFAGALLLMLLGLLTSALGGSVIQSVGIALFMYMSLRLALLPQVVVQDGKLRPLFFLSESFRLTKNRMLKILFVFFYVVLVVTVLSGLIQQGVGSEGSPNLPLQLVRAVLLAHIEVYFWLVLYRIYLDAVQDASDN